MALTPYPMLKSTTGRKLAHGEDSYYCPYRPSLLRLGPIGPASAQTHPSTIICPSIQCCTYSWGRNDSAPGKGSTSLSQNTVQTCCTIVRDIRGTSLRIEISNVLCQAYNAMPRIKQPGPWKRQRLHRFVEPGDAEAGAPRWVAASAEQAPQDGVSLKRALTFLIFWVPDQDDAAVPLIRI